MGGSQSSAQSRPPPPPTIGFDSYPVGEGVDGVFTGQFHACTECNLKVSNVSTAEVRLEREYGSITPNQCAALANDRDKVKKREMTVMDFMNNLQRGVYFRPTGASNETGKPCEQVKFPADVAADIKTIDDYDAKADKLIPIRARRVQAGMGDFSSDTKLTLIPNAPFHFNFNGVDVPVTKMRLYRPCPVRIDNIQYDAVFSLNDADDPNVQFILLIPIQVSSIPDARSDTFFRRFTPSIRKIIAPDTERASFLPISVPTGNNWKMSDILPQTGDTTGDLVIQSGFFAWKGQGNRPPYATENTSTHIQYGWSSAAEYTASQNAYIDQMNDINQIIAKAGGRPYVAMPHISGPPPGPQYLMLSKPVTVSSVAMSDINLLPVTPSQHAIHPLPTSLDYVYYREPIAETACEEPPTGVSASPNIPAPPSVQPVVPVGYSYNNPNNPSKMGEFVQTGYRTGDGKVVGTDGVTEKFDNKNSCSPFVAPPHPPILSSDTLMTILIGVFAMIATFIGVYFAIKYADGPGGDTIKKWGQKLGVTLKQMSRDLPRISPSESFYPERELRRAAAPAPAPASAPAPAPAPKKEEDKPIKLTDAQIAQALKAQETGAEARLSAPSSVDNPAYKSRDDFLKAQRSKTGKSKSPVTTAPLTAAEQAQFDKFAKEMEEKEAKEKKEKEEKAKKEREERDKRDRENAAGTGLLSAAQLKENAEASQPVRRVTQRNRKTFDGPSTGTPLKMDTDLVRRARAREAKERQEAKLNDGDEDDRVPVERSSSPVRGRNYSTPLLESERERARQITRRNAPSRYAFRSS